MRLFALIAFACLAFTSTAFAAPQTLTYCASDGTYRQACGQAETRIQSRRTRRAGYEDTGGDPRPAAWCAWWLRRYLHIPKSAFPPYQYNWARAFAGLGQPAPKGCTGCVAVFSRGKGGHVGLVESWDANGNPVILSGNFNGRVDTAPHSLKKLIALRWIG